jgi:hypothetical protein
MKLAVLALLLVVSTSASRNPKKNPKEKKLDESYYDVDAAVDPSSRRKVIVTIPPRHAATKTEKAPSKKKSHYPVSSESDEYEEYSSKASDSGSSSVLEEGDDSDSQSLDQSDSQSLNDSDSQNSDYSSSNSDSQSSYSGTSEADDIDQAREALARFMDDPYGLKEVVAAVMDDPTAYTVEVTDAMQQLISDNEIQAAANLAEALCEEVYMEEAIGLQLPKDKLDARDADQWRIICEACPNKARQFRQSCNPTQPKPKQGKSKRR